MMDISNWKRVRLPIPPCSAEQMEAHNGDLFLEACQAFWNEEIIPVVGWDPEFNGTELLPPVLN